MLYAVCESDEIINQIVTSLTKRKWIIGYLDSNGELYHENPNNKKKDKNTLKKIFKRLHMVESKDYELRQEIINPDLDECLMALHAKLKYIRERTLCDRMVLWLGPDDGSNFRFKSAITAPYKGTRPPKPDVLKQLRQYLINFKDAQVIYGYEADDAVAMCRIELDKYEKTILVSCDKDTAIIPGLRYNPMTDEFSDVTELGELTLNDGKVKGNGLYFFYYQLLVGDKVDNIPPMKKGWGPVRAYNALKDCQDEKDMLQAVLMNYRIELAESGGDMSYMTRLLEQADLVWICRNKEETGRQYIERRYRELFGGKL